MPDTFPVHWRRGDRCIPTNAYLHDSPESFLDGTAFLAVPPNLKPLQQEIDERNLTLADLAQMMRYVSEGPHPGQYHRLENCPGSGTSSG